MSGTAGKGRKNFHLEGILLGGAPLRTRPGPHAVTGVGEGQALGKRRGLREDRSLRVRGIQSWGCGRRRKELALRVAHCAGAAGWSVGPGTRPGRFFPLYRLIHCPHAQAHFCLGLVGGGGGIA